MSECKSRLAKPVLYVAFALFCACFLGQAAQGTVIPNPAPLVANGSVSVPLFDSSATNWNDNPRIYVDAYCYSGGCSTSVTSGQAVPLNVLAATLTGTGSFLEIAATTALNPFGSNDLAFGFLIGGNASNGVSSVMLPGFGNYFTDVQSCSEGISVDGITIPCQGTGISASRDGSGNITFSASSTFPTSSWTYLTYSLQNTGGFAIYTDAPLSALVDPSVTVTYSNGDTQEYAGLGLSTPSVPEPATLGLLSLGLAGLALAMLRRRASRR